MKNLDRIDRIKLMKEIQLILSNKGLGRSVNDLLAPMNGSGKAMNESGKAMNESGRANH